MQVVGNGEAQSSPDQDTEDTELMAIYAKESQEAEKVRGRIRARAAHSGNVTGL